ncbi:hypothetical protein EDD36DRAFT_294309 [Exophiala viscosa]|uniref:Uncharacterized protein n=1 Tax=Exophiala viscosa TaxID=2486360 RepID=A0AAN6DTY7_9EURO|nr:hypothetical protein EDD36DRAFT_294309 [Exophiala viscosa]
MLSFTRKAAGSLRTSTHSPRLPLRGFLLLQLLRRLNTSTTKAENAATLGPKIPNSFDRHRSRRPYWPNPHVKQSLHGKEDDHRGRVRVFGVLSRRDRLSSAVLVG